MRRIIMSIVGVVMFLLTTTILVLIPIEVPSMNPGQFALYLMMVICGYFVATMYMWYANQRP